MTRDVTRPATAALIAAALAAGLSACGGSNDKKSTTTATGTATTATGPGATTRRPSRNDQGGAQVESGPGSASVNSAGNDGATGAPGAAGIGSTSTAGIIRPFAASSPWNTQVLTSSVDARSNQWIRAVQVRIGAIENADGTTSTARRLVTDGLFINTTKWTTPVVDETNGVPTRVVCRQLAPYCGDGRFVSQLTVPANEDPRPQYDGWFTVLNRAQGVAYDMWRARRAPGQDTISYQFMRKWDLNGPGFQAPNIVSARGSGLPLFAGLILPEEIRAGRIDHALAISLPGPAQTRYVQPASASDGVGDANSLPEGARIRLKSSVHLTLRPCPRLTPAQIRRDPNPRVRCETTRTNQRAARAIFTALRRYGAIVVDRSRVPTLYAKLNANWATPLRDARNRLLDSAGHPLSRFVRALPNQGTPLLRGNEVQQLKVSDFQVVNTPGQVLTFPSLTSTRGAGSPSQAGGTVDTAAQGQTSSPGVP